MLKQILTFIKPEENFRITSIHDSKKPTQIGNIFYAVTENNISYSLKFTIIKSTNRSIKVQYTEIVSEYFHNQKVNEYEKTQIRYFNREKFDEQIAQLN